MGNCNEINCVNIPYSKLQSGGLVFIFRWFENLVQVDWYNRLGRIWKSKLIDLKVWKVKNRQDHKLYAMKEMCKVL